MNIFILNREEVKLASVKRRQNDLMTKIQFHIKSSKKKFYDIKIFKFFNRSAH